jgi:hypothetical protein
METCDAASATAALNSDLLEIVGVDSREQKKKKLI